MCVVVLEWMKYSNDEKGAAWDEAKSNTIYRLENEMIRVVHKRKMWTGTRNVSKIVMEDVNTHGMMEIKICR